MADPRPLYLGPRLRRLRRELGLTQQAMADDLAISASYVALLERNQRPVTADMLLRLARTYRLDMAEIAGDDADDYARRLADALRDPLFADIDLPALEVADLATSFPGISEALLRLHGAYLREQQALADRQQGAAADEDDPVREVQRFLASHRNYFHELDTKAESLAAEIDGAGGFEAWLAARGVRLRFMPPQVLMDSLRRFDRHNQQLLVADTLGPATRAFQIATHIAHSAMRAEIRAILRAATFRAQATPALVLRALAGYGAAALLMPYARFARAAEQRGYDIDALAALFGTGFEQVAHRLTTLQRPGAEGVGFFFIRIDEAGNVSKRLDGAGFPFAAHGGSCPLWHVHSAFRSPGRILTQWLELPGGERFFSIARTVAGPSAHPAAAPVMRAVALCCDAGSAGRLVYAGESDPAGRRFTPIGIACRLCQRPDCDARAVPPLGRDLLSDENSRRRAPFSFAET